MEGTSIKLYLLVSPVSQSQAWLSRQDQRPSQLAGPSVQQPSRTSRKA